MICCSCFFFFFFFFTDTATTEIYTLSLHDALPILPVGTRSRRERIERTSVVACPRRRLSHDSQWLEDRKSTRLNSSHVEISYAVFCLKKKKKKKTTTTKTKDKEAAHTPK